MQKEDRAQKVLRLNEMLLEEMPDYAAQAGRVPKDPASQRRLLRSLMNLRPPLPLRPEFLALQDEVLAQEREEKGIVEADDLPEVPGHPGIVLWQGDITRLRADAIVNAANSALLGCFVPCHGCVDNAIHSAAGLQLREACHRLIEAQGGPEPCGRAKLTPGYALPARYVLHTVGPAVSGGSPTAEDREALASCYRACLELAAAHGLRSVAFCCISTGVFGFPNAEAAQIAVRTVSDFLSRKTTIEKGIFNVFQDLDAQLYRTLLGLEG